jgi:hypothetical protein
MMSNSTSKYFALGEYLLAHSGDNIQLSFSDLEEILGFPLPKSALMYRTWWTNDRTHSHANNGWLSVGWRVSNINLENESVHFNRSEILRLDPPIIISKIVPLDNTLPTIERVRRFEAKARDILSDYLQTKLRPRLIQPVNRLFDFVSQDKQIIGDSKYFSMKGKRIQSTKYSAISENVWFLERVSAKRKFLVFGNNRAVPEGWLSRYGHLIQKIEFFFLDDHNQLLLMNSDPKAK